ncbi:MAG: hypothetical protein IJK15_04660 [Bacteroidaceae bacterium]|nr:hypothetical protein [Bacteroidaceae bacterium]
MLSGHPKRQFAKPYATIRGAPRLFKSGQRGSIAAPSLSPSRPLRASPSPPPGGLSPSLTGGAPRLFKSGQRRQHRGPFALPFALHRASPSPP